MNQVRKTLLMSLALLVTGAGVGLWAYFGVHEGNRKEQQRLDTEARAFPMSKDEVSALVVNPLGARVELERKNEGWQIVSPVQGPADDRAVNSLLDLLIALRSEEVLTEDLSNPERFGLELPRHSAKVVDSQGREFLLKVGEQNPFNQSTPFVVDGDERVHSTGTALSEKLDKKLFDLRSKALLKFTNDEVQTLEVRGIEESWRATREADSWQLEVLSGSAVDDEVVLRDLADSSEMGSVLSALRQARALDFPSEEQDEVALRAYGLDQPDFRVAIQLRDGASDGGSGTSASQVPSSSLGQEEKPDRNLDLQVPLDSEPDSNSPSALAGDPNRESEARLELGTESASGSKSSPGKVAGTPSLKEDGVTESAEAAVFEFALSEGRLYARRVGKGSIMEFKPDLQDRVLKKLDVIRDRRVARFDKEEVRRFSFAAAAQEPVVVRRWKEKREGVSWETEMFAFEDGDRSPKKWRLSSAIHTLSTLRADAVVDDNPQDLKGYGLDSPRYTYILYNEDGEELARVLIGSEAGDSRYYAMNTLTGRVVEVDQSTADELPQSLEDVSDLESAAADEH